MPKLLFRLAFLCIAAAPANAQDRSDHGVVAWVADGDTFRLVSGERIRIARIDAPETQVGQAKCSREIERGKAATTRARGLLQGRAVDFVRVGRSHNRTVARVSLEGRDLGDLLVAQGIARTWPPYSAKPDWCRD